MLQWPVLVLSSDYLNSPYLGSTIIRTKTYAKFRSAQTSAPWERRWFSARSMYRVFHKAHAFNRLNHGVALTSGCRTKVRTNDLQSEQLPALVRYAKVWKFP